jgi:HEAT repeat protein
MSNQAVTGEVEKIPIDARLLSDAIIELNISRRNVAIYPKDHPSADRSLSRAFDFMQRLFELRPEITLAVAKDTLIIDDYYLDKRNPVYREFALHLSKLNIVYVTFITGLTKDELYEFHRLVSEKINDTSPEAVQGLFRELNLIHIRAEFIDYGAFLFEEGKTQKEIPNDQLWERYVYGLLEGTLNTDDISDTMKEIPPEILAHLLNRTADPNMKEETYDKVITTYIRRSAETVFSGNDLKRLLDFINGLKPEIKKQFLSSTARTLSTDIDSTYRALKEVSVDEVIELLGVMNEQTVAIPDSLKNLLDKLSGLSQNGIDNLTVDGNILMDDIFLSPDIVNLFGESNSKTFISAKYQKDIQKLLDFNASTVTAFPVRDVEKQYSDAIIEKNFNQIILELMVSEIISEEEYTTFVAIVKEQLEQFLWTGQYKQILKTLKVFELLTEKGSFPDITSEAIQYYHSSEFISKLIESLRVLGRQTREESWLLCEHYSDVIISLLMDALVQEDSQTVRKFLLGLLKQFGDRVIPEAAKRLGDSRWFVKRNMLYILGELNREEVIPHIRSYCRHNNQKVSIEAIKCLLSFGDRYGVEVVKEFLRSESEELVMQAVALSGAFRIKEVVADLIQLLKKKGMSGADLYEKIPVVKALGDIGDASAINTLRDLLSCKSIFFKGMAERLKEEIYRSLKNYPYEAVQDLVHEGLKSKNECIREESLRLSKAITG